MKTYEIKKSDTRPGFYILTHGSKKRFGETYYAETLVKAEEYKKYLEGLVAEREEAKASRRAARSAARRGIANPWKVGQLFHYSWGWEQTNCEFFEAVAVTEKTVTLRAIAGEGVPGTQGFMSEKRAPVVGAFLENSEPFTKTLQCYVTPDGKAGAPYISMDHGSCSPCNPEDNFYCSWYA